VIFRAPPAAGGPRGWRSGSGGSRAEGGAGTTPQPSASAPSRRDRFLSALAAALVLLAYSLAFQGSRGLWEPDEGRYTNIAGRMLRTGDFVVPAFNHEAPHFAKPPLTYWAIAAGIAALGWNEWGARLANALAFAATTLVVYLLGRRFTPARPWLPALVYGTFLLPHLAANIITTDTLLTLWESAGVLLFVVWWERREQRWQRLPLLGMWLAFGLAFLTKGPPGLLPLLVIVAFAGLAGGWRAVPALMYPGGLLVFAAVGLGWYAFVAATNPGLIDYFLHDELMRRIASGDYRRNSQWYGALRVYLPTIVIGMLPWTFVWIARWRQTRRTLLSLAWWRDALGTARGGALLALWVAIPLLAFSLVRSRLPLYALPLFVPLALATARLLGRWAPRRATAALLGVWALALVGGRWGASHLASPADSRAAARAIREQVAPDPLEVAFVDVKPLWGLSLYLRCEVERIVTASAVGRTLAGVSPESLSVELTEREPRALLIITPSLRDEVGAGLARLGLPYVELGVAAGGLLVAPMGDLGRADPVTPAP